jgi:hypothetical protein
LLDAGVSVVTIYPPVSIELNAAQGKSGRFQVIDEMRRRVGELAPSVDFHDIASMTTDCEMIDGIHPGEVLVMRMLVRMASEPNNVLRDFVDLPALQAKVDRYAGKVAAYDVPRAGDPSRRETDFLKIGCDKSGGHRTGPPREASTPARGAN